jgi:hypothetical protein
MDTSQKKATYPKEVLMDATMNERWNMTSEEQKVLTDLLELERSKLMVEIRHTDHRSFREELRHRLTVIEGLLQHCQPS